MSVSKVIASEDAVRLVRSGDVVASSGYGGHGVPEQLLVSLEERFLESGTPPDLTLVFAGGQGDGGDLGLNHLGHEGMLRRVIAGHYGLVPKIATLAISERVEAYNFPEGVIVHLYRNMAAGGPGLLSTVGIGTFVDPRIEGGKVNKAASQDLVEVVEFGGEEWLLYRSIPIDVTLIRGTTADPLGNITMEHEALSLEALDLAIAARTSGGTVLCQVERIAEEGSLNARDVRIPSVLVDAVIVAAPEHHRQTFGTDYDPAMSGELRIPARELERRALDHRKVIARRAACELGPDTTVNLGIGLPDLIGGVVAEEHVQDLITLTVDPGVFGGVPLGGFDFGAAVNHQAVIDHGSAFDFIDGGGVDAVFLGVAQVDARGDVNVSRFGDVLTGCGGFINLTQRSDVVVFLTTFSSAGLKTRVADGHLVIEDEGSVAKFVDAVDQITFSAAHARSRGQSVIYVTERCVFRLGDRGLVLTELAPGIDLDRQVLRLLPFDVEVEGPEPMWEGLFRPESLGLRRRMMDVHIEDRLSYDALSNTVFMDYSGMHVRTADDVAQIIEAVGELLGPLGHKVNSIVNYDRFLVDEEAVDAYAEAVRYVSETYYLKVSRHSSSSFTRLKLGDELTRRLVAPALYSSEEEAAERLEAGAIGDEA